MQLPSHLMASESDGALYDTRQPGWSKAPPLRPIFRRSYTHIRNTAELKATLRNGAYAWPGGYPLYLLTDDGGALHYDCARRALRSVLSAIADKCSNGWRVVACDANYEDGELCCDDCGKRIESAYRD